MKTALPAAPRGLLASAFISMALAVPLLRAADGLPAVAKPAVNAPVTVTDSSGAWTLDNGIVKATISKGNGRMTALVFHGINTMARRRILGTNTSRCGPTVSRLIRRKTAASAPRLTSRAALAGALTLNSATPWRAASAAFTPTRFTPTRRPAARPVMAKTATSPSSTRTSIGSRWIPTATCSNARRRIGARASSSTPRSSAF